MNWKPSERKIRERLTAKQAQALATYTELLKSLGFPPSIREFSDAYGVSSTSSGYCMLEALRRRGFNVVTRGQSKVRDNRAEILSVAKNPDQAMEINDLRRAHAELVDENEGLKIELCMLRQQLRDAGVPQVGAGKETLHPRDSQDQGASHE